MTRLEFWRKNTKQKLREVAVKVGVKPSTVHDAEVRGIQTPRAAKRYMAAFPGAQWQDLIG